MLHGSWCIDHAESLTMLESYEYGKAFYGLYFMNYIMEKYHMDCIISYNMAHPVDVVLS